MVDNPTETQRLWDEMLQSMRRDGVLNSSDVDAAFSAVPRHLFLPDISIEKVYKNRAIGLKKDGSGLLTSSSSQPSMMAIMLNQLQLQTGDNILEIGTASGYNAAIMQHIVGKSGTVTTVEIDNDLAETAHKNLQRAHMSRVMVVNADGAQGYSPRAAYDHIVVTVGVWDIPSVWFSQLKLKGSLVAPIVLDGVQVSATFKPMSDGTFLSKDNRPCAFVYMLGSNAGPNFRKQLGTSGLFVLADQVDNIDTVSLSMLLSDDHAFCQFEHGLEPQDYWNGYQIYLMLNQPEKYIFFVYSVFEDQQAFGLDGQGIGLFTKGTAALAGYHEKGVVHCFAGSDAFLEMQTVSDKWFAEEKPSTEQLRLKLIPKELGRPEVERGRIFDRRDHYLHAWFDVD
ncbi:MAG: rRNA adenine N-6-methyltransferase family protein [Chloroflexota bacterium]